MPMVKSRRMTPTSAAASTSAWSCTRPSACGPITTPGDQEADDRHEAEAEADVGDGRAGRDAARPTSVRKPCSTRPHHSVSGAPAQVAGPPCSGTLRGLPSAPHDRPVAPCRLPPHLARGAGVEPGGVDARGGRCLVHDHARTVAAHGGADADRRHAPVLPARVSRRCARRRARPAPPAARDADLDDARRRGARRAHPRRHDDTASAARAHLHPRHRCSHDGAGLAGDDARAGAASRPARRHRAERRRVQSGARRRAGGGGSHDRVDWSRRRLPGERGVVPRRAPGPGALAAPARADLRRAGERLRGHARRRALRPALAAIAERAGPQRRVRRVRERRVVPAAAGRAPAARAGAGRLRTAARVSRPRRRARRHGVGGDCASTS